MATAAIDLRTEARRRARARLDEIRQRKHLHDTDLVAFAADCLTIRPKKGDDCLFRFNRVQNIVHEQIEDQRRRTGRVRKVILKARQPGVSTYVTGRFYHRTSRNRGIRAFILTHEQDATDNVFEMVRRFHEHDPDAPHAGAASAKELYFDDLDSGFAVGTAGSKGVGRSRTLQLFHGSEVAIWPNAELHTAGIMQAIPDIEGTEAVLESTANGSGGYFYNVCQAAMRGEGPFELIFIPWFDHTEYQKMPPDGWAPPAWVTEYGQQHRLTLPQTYWAYDKNIEFATAEGSSPDELCWKFQQEYPATAEEAFRASRKGAFIGGNLVIRARKFTAPAQDHAPLVLGVDLATGGDGEGGDQNVIIDRQGRAAGRNVYKRWTDKNAVSTASTLAAEIDRLKPLMTFIDTGGGGAQVHDILRSRGYDRLTLVDFGAGATDNRKYFNKRAEMYGHLREWLADPGGADIPDDDVLDGEITASKSKEDWHARVQLQKKAQVRKDIGHSPDGSDALVCTFAETVHDRGRSKLDLTGGLGLTGKSWMGG